MERSEYFQAKARPRAGDQPVVPPAALPGTRSPQEHPQPLSSSRTSAFVKQFLVSSAFRVALAGASRAETHRELTRETWQGEPAGLFSR